MNIYKKGERERNDADLARDPERNSDKQTTGYYVVVVCVFF